MKLSALKHVRTLLTGIILALPLFLLNAMAAMDIPAFQELFRGVFSLGMFVTNPVGSIVVTASLLLLPVASIVLVRPIFSKFPGGDAKLCIFNALLGALIFAFFCVFVGAMSMEVYRCDVLKIANCD